MKNISIHSLIGLTVLCMSSCTDDYTDWATPQANEQEAAITLPDFSASKVDDINLSNPGSSIKLFTLSNATLPEGYTLGNVRVELSTEKGKAGELESNTDGMIDSLTIQKLVVETYGKRPIARPFIAQVYANAIKDGQALLVNAGSFDVNFTPAAPFIDTGYYLVGDMFTIKNDKDETSVNGWSADGMVGFSHSGTDVYEDSKFSIVFTTTADNQCWKIIPKTNTEGEFWGAGVLGTVTDGDTATEGTLTTNNPQAGMITQAGMYRMTLDMMEYTYTLEELGFAPYIYEIGNNTSWSGTCPLAGINFDGKYRGFAYLNGEFKYKPNPEKDNWTGDWEKVSGDALAGTLDENGAGNIDAPEAGFYMMTLDMMEYTYTLEELGFAPYIYEIGNNTSWSGTCPLAGINFDGKYRGFAYLNGEFKYKPNPEKDNWTGDWEKVSGDALAGTLDENGAGNIDAPEAGFYMMEVDLTAMTYKHTLISTLGVIGSATPSGWDADTDMTYNEEDGSWNLTTNLTDGEIKIRANNDWDINWGGSIAEPTFNAGNIAVTAGNYTIRFIPQCDGMNLLTLTKN